jgi:addiction module HigA family antidote
MTAPHPGELLKAKILELGITQDVFAKGTNIHFVTLNRLIKGHEKFTPRHDAVLCKAFSLKQGFFLHAAVDHEIALFMADPDKKKGKAFKMLFSELMMRGGVFD